MGTDKKPHIRRRAIHGAVKIRRMQKALAVTNHRFEFIPIFIISAIGVIRGEILFLGLGMGALA